MVVASPDSCTPESVLKYGFEEITFFFSKRKWTFLHVIVAFGT